MLPAKGDRVELVTCNDEYTRLKPGTFGTVTLVNVTSFGTTVFVDWDDGSRLGLCPDNGDAWRVVGTEES